MGGEKKLTDVRQAGRTAFMELSIDKALGKWARPSLLTGHSSGSQAQCTLPDNTLVKVSNGTGTGMPLCVGLAAVFSDPLVIVQVVVHGR